jgi:hypothetical protein
MLSFRFHVHSAVLYGDISKTYPHMPASLVTQRQGRMGRLLNSGACPARCQPDEYCTKGSLLSTMTFIALVCCRAEPEMSGEARLYVRKLIEDLCTCSIFAKCQCVGSCEMLPRNQRLCPLGSSRRVIILNQRRRQRWESLRWWLLSATTRDIAEDASLYAARRNPNFCCILIMIQITGALNELEM